jgi:tetratricopeptide (TPR) repeat protein
MHDRAEEDAFLRALAHTKLDLQANMSLEAIYTHLPEPAQKLLQRLPAHYQPVPAEGILKLGLDLSPDPQPLLERLLAVSLLEALWDPDWQVLQFQCAPLLSDWLRGQNLIDANPLWIAAVADYHLYLYDNERHTLSQAITTHAALRRADRLLEADRLALDKIVGPLSRAGFYVTLLSEWLPTIFDSQDLQTRREALNQAGMLNHHLGNYETALDYFKQSLAICQQIGDKQGEGSTLNNISQIFKAQGDYQTALDYLKQSLAIRQQIGDNAGLCATLFNMGHLHAQNKQMDEAVKAWVTVYILARQIGLAQALQALEDLAPQLGLPAGLAGWEQLAQRMQAGSDQSDPQSETDQVARFVQAVVLAVKTKNADAPKFFESVSEMAIEPEAPPEFRELGKVLRQYMSGIQHPDLSALPASLAQLVTAEFER